MLAWLKYIPLLPRLVTFVTSLLGAIHDVETMITTPGAGAQKKAAVLAVIGQAVGIAQAIGIPGLGKVDPQEVETLAGPVIDALVLVLNTLGVFTHKAPAAGT